MSFNTELGKKFFLFTALIIFSFSANAAIETKQVDAPINIKSGKNLSAQFNFVTNYVFRGISQTQNQPAIQGVLAYSFLPSGIYLCLFGSNDHLVGIRNEILEFEIDPSIGITNKIGDHASYDINIFRYIYPQGNNNSYNEFNSYFNYYFVTAQFSYSNDDYATGKSGFYYNLGFNYELPARIFFNINNLRVSGGIGYSILPENVGLHSYKDYNLSISRSINLFTFLLGWTNTDGQSTDARSLKGNKVFGVISVNL